MEIEDNLVTYTNGDKHFPNALHPMHVKTDEE